MKTNFSLLFYMKKQKNYTKGAAPIYLRITVAGKRAETTTGRECEPDRWNAKTGRISGTSHPNAKNGLARSFAKYYLLAICNKEYDDFSDDNY